LLGNLSAAEEGPDRKRALKANARERTARISSLHPALNESKYTAMGRRGTG
jgi:hypothetical protein